MPVQELYVSTVARVCAAMSTFSDRETAATFARLGRTIELIGLRLAGTDKLTIDRSGSGLPLLNQVLGLTTDMREGVECADDSHDIRKEMLDHMLARRRKPDDQMRARMAKAVYAETLARNHLDVFLSEPEAIALIDEPGTEYAGMAAWDFWDGSTSTPTHLDCRFTVQDGAYSPELLDCARTFSGTGFKPISLAAEIDERAPGWRLSRLRKLTIGPFRSDIFTAADDMISKFLATGEGDPERCWAFSWSDDRVLATGTTLKNSGGLFGFLRTRPYQLFALDGIDMDKVARGCSEFDLHLLLPHAVYQAMADDRAGQAYLEERRVHILSDDGKITEDV